MQETIINAFKQGLFFRVIRRDKIAEGNTIEYIFKPFSVECWKTGKIKMEGVNGIMTISDVSKIKNLEVDVDSREIRIYIK